MPRIAGGRIVSTGVGTLDRAIAVIDAVDRGDRTHAQVAAATGLSRSTAYRLLKALEAHRFLALDGGAGYRLGPRLMELAARSLPDGSLRAAGHAALERLAAVTGESAQLFVAGAPGERVCIDAVPSANELRTIVSIGSALPITAGSAGKVFLAWLPSAVRDPLIDRAEALTPATPTGDRLRRQLATTRRLGWSWSAGEREPGVGSVSAPVLSSEGNLVAVVSISGPTSRVDRATATALARDVRAAAGEVADAIRRSG